MKDAPRPFQSPKVSLSTRLFRRPDAPRRAIQKLYDFTAARIQKRLNFGGPYRFKDRQNGKKGLVTVVAGYKEPLWPVTLERIARFVHPDLDVCVVTPGRHVAPLESWADRHGWSVLATRANKLALAQNLAVRSHPNARWIFKLDEDIVIPEGYFESMLEGFLRARREGPFNPGFCAPLLNVNGFSYVLFLRALGLEEEFRSRFGEPISACIGIPAHYDGKAACWIWEHSLPFDERAAYFSAQPFKWSSVPHRFSIGAILLERGFWKDIGGFKASFANGVLGIEESHLCGACVEGSRPMVVLHNVFAGHLGFRPQEPALSRMWPRLKADLILALKKDEAFGSLETS